MHVNGHAFVCHVVRGLFACGEERYRVVGGSLATPTPPKARPINSNEKFVVRAATVLPRKRAKQAAISNDCILTRGIKAVITGAPIPITKEIALKASLRFQRLWAALLRFQGDGQLG